MPLCASVLALAASVLLPTLSQPALGKHAPVLAAIEAMLTAPLERDVSEEARLVANFAEESRDVEITLDARHLGFIRDDVPASLRADLLSFYLAGAVRFDLTHPDQRSEPTADVVPGLEAVLQRYRQYKTRNPRYRDPFLERVSAYAARGALHDFVATAPAAPTE